MQKMFIFLFEFDMHGKGRLIIIEYVTALAKRREELSKRVMKVPVVENNRESINFP